MLQPAFGHAGQAFGMLAIHFVNRAPTDADV